MFSKVSSMHLGIKCYGAFLACYETSTRLEKAVFSNFNFLFFVGMYESGLCKT
ncbi:hypothetical protein APHCRT_1660 [Anaplasma phagocytophilum str. CRT53-1]|uniref:Uncharacterized protein n=1 Tax=Anaplasma phagocytophilum str. CRT53-1 TaxID=1359157 RepID=A0A0F3PIM4_ANAPH|nr:hypothetical protein APHCRT_1660 [Anaplasma phagocytophilum str. CRT53-1]